jgi:hypothetical protein
MGPLSPKEKSGSKLAQRLAKRRLSGGYRHPPKKLDRPLVEARPGRPALQPRQPPPPSRARPRAPRASNMGGQDKSFFCWPSFPPIPASMTRMSSRPGLGSKNGVLALAESEQRAIGVGVNNTVSASCCRSPGCGCSPASGLWAGQSFRGGRRYITTAWAAGRQDRCRTQARTRAQKRSSPGPTRRAQPPPLDRTGTFQLAAIRPVPVVQKSTIKAGKAEIAARGCCQAYARFPPRSGCWPQRPALA